MGDIGATPISGTDSVCDGPIPSGTAILLLRYVYEKYRRTSKTYYSFM